MSSSESASDSEPEFESIIATRARRSNAGSRLRQLLDLEETAADQAMSSLNDDDDNVRLLFQEDEEDFEFKESDDNDEDANDDSQEEENNGEEVNVANNNEQSSDHNEEDIVNADEMLSDSDISASDSDEYEGEKELEKQERLKRRRQRKSNVPAALQMRKKQKTEPTTIKQSTKSKEIRKKSPATDIVPIAPGERRHSERKATMKNSIETHEKLEKEYEKRLTQVPVAKKEHVEMTLEERLEEAKITEKENMLSLTRFYEQEVQKKKKQRDLANSKKIHLTNYIRFWSSGIYVTPLDEVEMIEEKQRLIREEQEKRERRKLMYQKRKQARLGIDSTKQKNTIKSDLDNNGTENKESKDAVEDKTKDTDSSADTGNANKSVLSAQNLEVSKQHKSDTKTNDAIHEAVDESFPDGKPIEKPEPIVEIKTETDQPASGESRTSDVNQDKEKTPEAKCVRFSEDVHVKTDGTEVEVEKIADINLSTTPESNCDGLISDDTSSESVHVDSVPKRIFEGPSQLAACNYIIFEEFEKDITTEDVKKYLFGRQAVLTGTQRDPLYETIHVIKQDKMSNLDLEKIQSNRNESFKSLLKLPKFGEKVTYVEDGNNLGDDNENETVHISTPAPVGIHLPNGQRKLCLTTGIPAMYYDPTNGVPYATVDAFRILKNLADGEFNWLQLDNGGINSRYKGGVGCYLSKKKQRHAKGVPEWFGD